MCVLWSGANPGSPGVLHAHSKCPQPHCLVESFVSCVNEANPLILVCTQSALRVVPFSQRVSCLFLFVVAVLVGVHCPLL